MSLKDTRWDESGKGDHMISYDKIKEAVIGDVTDCEDLIKAINDTLPQSREKAMVMNMLSTHLDLKRIRFGNFEE